MLLREISIQRSATRETRYKTTTSTNTEQRTRLEGNLRPQQSYQHRPSYRPDTAKMLLWKVFSFLAICTSASANPVFGHVKRTVHRYFGLSGQYEAEVDICQICSPNTKVRQ
jgi:hypothetical protein